jgi:hypothetical protein
MNKKQKAEELINLFWKQIDCTDWENAKECAIICIDEILKVVPYISKENCNTIEEIRSPDYMFSDWWEGVKNEIKNFK